MKKINIFGLLLLLVGSFTSCKEENLIFEIEQPQFDTREGYMLLEVIPPYKTMENDQIYIIGDFNGGMDAVGDPRWLLQKGPGSTVQRSKWGIYLDPADFVDGKSLADGYTFFNIQQGEERSLDNKAVTHTEYPALGGRLNVMVYFWADNFNAPQSPDEVEHDGYTIYLVDNSGWVDTYLYTWSDSSIDGVNHEIFGGWPGALPTGKVTQGGITYKYWDTGASNENLSINLIFNNNSGAQTDNYGVTLDQDYYLELTPDGVVPFDPSASIEHDGYTVYVNNLSGWDALYLYIWGDGINDLVGGWPGMAPTGTQTINGVTYTYFDLKAENSNNVSTAHVILNNNAGNQVDDVVVFNIDRDVYLELTAKGATEIDPENYNPSDPGPSDPSEPDDPQPSAEYNIYIQNETGWNNFYLYAYGDANIFGDWPGETSNSTTTIGGVEYLVFTVSGAGETEHLIFNNNEGTQIEQGNMIITIDQNWYIKVTATEATFIEAPMANIYVNNQTGWDEIYLYGWGEAGNDLFGNWPGTLSESTSTVNGVNYLVWTFPANGKTENLIFNNGKDEDAKVQTPDFGVTLNTDMFLKVTAEGAKFENQ